MWQNASSQTYFNCQQMNQKFCWSRVCVLLWFGFQVFGFVFCGVFFLYCPKITAPLWFLSQDKLSWKISLFHPPTCSLWLTLRFPYSLQRKESQCWQGIVLFGDADASLQESSWRPRESQLYPRRWRCLSCLFCLFHFFSVDIFIGTLKNPHKYFRIDSERFFPSWSNQSPFARLK